MRLKTMHKRRRRVMKRLIAARKESRKKKPIKILSLHEVLQRMPKEDLRKIIDDTIRRDQIFPRIPIDGRKRDTGFYAYGGKAKDDAPNENPPTYSEIKITRQILPIMKSEAEFLDDLGFRVWREPKEDGSVRKVIFRKDEDYKTLEAEVIE